MHTTIPRVQTVLFLCTGNYYRSRFAELLFNHLTTEAGLAWRAESRGLATELGSYNVGPIAPVVIATLRGILQDGIPLNVISQAATPRDSIARHVEAILQDEACLRFPRQVQPADLATADLTIALDEQEHRPYMAARFPEWMERVEYWHVHDLGAVPAAVALAQIEQETRRLIQRLQATA